MTGHLGSGLLADPLTPPGAVRASGQRSSNGSPGRLMLLLGFLARRQVADPPDNRERRVVARAWFGPLDDEALAFIERSGTLVASEVFDVQASRSSRKGR